MHLLEKNPKTIERIGKILLSLDIDTIFELSTKPKSPSRQMGSAFKNWLKSIDYPFLTKSEFQKSNKIAFLEGNDAVLKNFANKELNIKNLTKGIDFILKIKNKHIIGEAKFLTDYGGTQNNQFNDAIKITKINRNNVLGVAVLDGIVWFESKAKMHEKIKKINGTALSALLLEKFIQDINQ